MALTYRKVPMADHTYRPIWKPDGFGQNNLGKRHVFGVVLHTMQGTLWGTDTYFRFSYVAALTDFGIDPATGEMLKWNEPWGGYQSGWASGPVSRPYGDGKRFVDEYGINAVNRHQASIEIGGYFNAATGAGLTPLGSKAKRKIAQTIAYYYDQNGWDWTAFPNVPSGYSFVRWHQEFTIGTGKLCPGSIVMNATNEIIDIAGRILKDYQEDGVEGEAEIIVPRYAPTILPPTWVDKDTAIQVGNDFFFPVGKDYRVKRKTNARQRASTRALYTRQPFQVGEWFHAKYMVKDTNGAQWYVTPGGHRIKASFTEAPEQPARSYKIKKITARNPNA